MLSKVAFRNIFRNTRRSSITLLVLVFGVTALILFGGYKEISFYGIREGFIRGRLAHLQIYQRGYLNGESSKPLEIALDNVQGLRKIIEQDPRVEMTAAQISLMGLVTNGEKSEAFIATAVEPVKDKAMPAQRIVSGKFLSDKDRDEVFIGEPLARSLKVKAGDYLTLMTTTLSGSLNGMDVRISGVFSTGMKEYDERAIKIPLAAAQKLLHTTKVEKLLVMLKDTKDTAAVQRDLGALFTSKHLPLELRNWSDLATYYHQVVMLYNGIFGFLGLVVFAIVVLSVANTIMMSAFERTREIGTMMAIGTERRQVLAVFLLEGLFVGILGGVSGLLFGGGLAEAINHAHLQLPPPPGYTEGVPFRIMLNASILEVAFALAAATATVASIFPALKASRMKIVDALGHI